MDDDDEEFLAPPDDNVAPDFGGWELFVLLGLHKRDERYFQRAIADPQFDLNTRFEYVKRVRMSYYVRVTTDPEVSKKYEVTFGRVSITKSKIKAGDGMVKTDIQFDAPSHAKTGQAFHSVKECYDFQDWMLSFDKKVGPRLKTEGRTESGLEHGRSEHDSLLFTIIRNKFFFRDGRSTGLLEILGTIPFTSRKYPDLTSLDGQGKTVYEVCKSLGLGDFAENCLTRAFPVPKSKKGRRKKSCVLQ